MKTRLHPTAVIHRQAELGAGVVVGPYCVIGAGVRLGAGCRLHSHVVLDGRTRVGARCEFYPFACVGLKSQDLKQRGGGCRLEIGADNVFREHATVHTATTPDGVTRIGSGNLLMAYSHVAHDCVVGDEVVLSNCGTMAGHVVIEDQVVVGGLAAIHQFCRIGRLAMVGGCAKVVQDVAPYMIVDGNPAVTRGVNKVGLERHGVPAATRQALREAYKIVYRSGLTVSNGLDRVCSELPKSGQLEHFVDFCRTSERGIAR